MVRHVVRGLPRTRRPSTVRQAEAHIAQIVAAFGPMRLGAVGRRTCGLDAQLAAEGLADSYVYALHRGSSQLYGRRRARRDPRHVAVLASHLARPGSSGPTSRRRSRCGRSMTRCPSTCAPAILLGAFVGLRVAEPAGCGSPTSTSCAASSSPAVQYPAEPLKTETSRRLCRSREPRARVGGARRPRWQAGLLVERVGRPARAVGARTGDAAARGEVTGLPAGFRFHDLRHYFASLLIASGADVKVVQARLRHASAKTTLDTYGHLWPDTDETTRTAIDVVMAARAELLADSVRTEGPS